MTYTPATVCTDLLTLLGGSPTIALQAQAYTQALTLGDLVYGRDSAQMLDLRGQLEQVWGKNAQSILFTTDEADISTIITALTALADDATTSPTIDAQQQLYMRTLTLMQSLYGPGSSHEADLRSMLGAAMKQVGSLGYQQIRMIDILRGAVNAMDADVDSRKVRWVEILTGFVTGVQADLTEGW